MASTARFSNVTAEEFQEFLEQLGWSGNNYNDAAMYLGFDRKTAWRYLNGHSIPIPLGLLVRIVLRQKLTSKYILALKE